MPDEPKPDHPKIDPATGIKPISEWGSSCHRGFISDSRFGSGQVIKRTNRDVTRRWRRSVEKEGPTTK